MAKELTLELDKYSYNQLMRVLGEYSKVDQKRAIKSALLKGVREISKQGKLNLTQRNKRKSGNLLKSFSTKFLQKYLSSYAGFRKGKSRGGNHAHLVDSGTKARYTKKGFYRGKVKGTKFWRDAVRTKGTTEMRNLFKSIYNELIKVK